MLLNHNDEGMLSEQSCLTIQEVSRTGVEGQPDNRKPKDELMHARSIKYGVQSLPKLVINVQIESSASGHI